MEGGEEARKNESWVDSGSWPKVCCIPPSLSNYPGAYHPPRCLAVTDSYWVVVLLEVSSCCSHVLLPSGCFHGARHYGVEKCVRPIDTLVPGPLAKADVRLHVFRTPRTTACPPRVRECRADSLDSILCARIAAFSLAAAMGNTVSSEWSHPSAALAFTRRVPAL